MLRADPFCVGLQGLGFMCVKSTHSGKAFNPCPLTAPSLHGFPLYMDMFCFSSFFLLAALSVAQRGTYSLFIGTYLGKGRNPMFLSNPYSLPWPVLSALTCITLSIFAFYSFLLFLLPLMGRLSYSVCLHFVHVKPENFDGEATSKEKKSFSD